MRTGQIQECGARAVNSPRICMQTIAFRDTNIFVLGSDILTRLFSRLAILVAVVRCAGAADSVGSQACARCHAAIYRSFMATPMAHSSGRVGTGEPKESFAHAEFRDARGAFSYRVGQQAGMYYFEFAEQDARQPVRGRRQVEYFVGSGAAARSYLMSAGGFLYEAPVAYYRNLAAWNAAPGYATFDYPYLTRPVLPGCLNCHASGIERIAGTQNAYASPPFREGGVGCERCHGPGSDHIAAGQPMINPAKLGAAERDSICEQCHLSGEIRVPKAGKDDLSFRPGGRLADVLAVFVRSGSSSEMRVTSHVENLEQSVCKRASGDKLWCGSCHDPHSVPAANEKVAYFRAKCLACHQTSACSAAASLRRANGDNCTACHMPRNPPSDVEHVVFTDHAIARHPRSAASEPPMAAELVPYGGGEGNARDLGLAYAMVGLREQNAVYQDRAFQLLQKAAESGAADTEALAYLAEFYRDRKDDAHALPLYQEVWRKDSAQAAVAAALGAYQMQYGHLEEAIRFWNQALAINPAMVLVRTNLATVLLRAGRAEDARATLREALEFNPAFAEARELLGRIR